jgi:uncharacterized protein (TIGR02145 family)
MPTDFEWATLLDAVDGEGTGTAYRTQTNGGWAGTNDATGAGAKMKSAATHTDTDPGDGSWAGDNVGNNATGFGVVPAGSRANTGAQLNSRGGSVNYWSSSIGYSTAAWCRYFYSGYGHVSRSYEYRSYGFSVRCMKN